MTIKNWAATEFSNVDLGDERLNKRLVNISQQFLESPNSPINKACGDWSDTKAAYRFFQNESVDYKDIVKAHASKSLSRSLQEPLVLAIQDTTYYNYTDHKETTGLGILSRFKGKHKDEILTKGLCMHTTLGIAPDGLPIGILDQQIYSRQALSKEMSEIKKRTHNNALSIDEKESIRWLNSMRSTYELFKETNQRVVTVADREADIYDLYHLAEQLETHFLIRSSHNRKINKSAIHSESSGEMLWDFIKKEKVIGHVQVEVPEKDDQPKRLAKCSIKVGKLSLLPPRNYKGSKNEPTKLTLYAIYIEEIKPPNINDAIEWMLCTNIPTSTFTEAAEKLQWYCLRWRIEVYFKVIKSGFNVEDCRLETADRLIRYLSVISIVAWQVYWLTLISRTAPNISASIFLSEFEWKLLFIKYNPNKKPPSKAPNIKKVTVWIAQLGGFLARQRDGNPGVTHIWRGLKKFASIIEGAKLFQDICG